VVVRITAPQMTTRELTDLRLTCWIKYDAYCIQRK